MPLVDTFEQRVDRRRGGLFGDRDDLLNPNDGGLPDTPGASDLDQNVPSLVVRSVVANGLATRAQTGDWDLNSKSEVVTEARHFANKPTLVVHQCHGATYWRCSFDEIRKYHFNTGTLGLQPHSK